MSGYALANAYVAYNDESSKKAVNEGLKNIVKENESEMGAQ